MKAYLLWLLLVLSLDASRAQAPLLICLPGGQSPARLDSALGPSLAPRKVIAFLRVRDLEDMLPTYPKALVLTTSAYAAYLNGYSIELKGKKRDSRSRYLVVTADSTLDSAGLASKRIGILDFLGREKIPRFVEDAFGWKPSALKRVNKQEDLMSLLGMDAVDAIIVEARDFPDLKRETKLRLFVVRESKPIFTFPVLAMPAGGDAGVKEVLIHQSKAALEILGVERWE